MRTTTLDKEKITIYLLATAILLMFVRLGIDHFTKILPENNLQSVKTSEVDTLLLSSFKEYGIEPAWIQKVIRKKAKSDSIGYYKVQMPADLPIPILLNGIGQKFKEKSIQIVSREYEVNGRTSVNLINEKRVICQAEFIVNKLLVRKAADFGIILNRFSDLNENEIVKIISIPEKYAAVLTPSQNSEKIIGQLISAEKEYVIVLNDNIEEPNFKIEEDFETQRIKNAISEIIKTFSSAKLFLIDDGSKLYKSSVFNLVSNEFKKRKLPLVKISTYNYIRKHDGQEINYYFQRVCENNVNGEKKVLLINAEDFTGLSKEMEKFRNKGYKFILPSSINYGT